MAHLPTQISICFSTCKVQFQERATGRSELQYIDTMKNLIISNPRSQMYSDYFFGPSTEFEYVFGLPSNYQNSYSTLGRYYSNFI